MFSNQRSSQFRPTTYAEAYRFLMERKFKGRSYRNIGGLDSIIGEGSPEQIEAGTCPISFRYHITDIVTFHPDGSKVVRPYYSVSTNQRYEDLGVPTITTASAQIGAQKYKVEDQDRWFLGHGYCARLGMPAQTITVLPNGTIKDVDKIEERVRIPNDEKIKRFNAQKRAVAKAFVPYLRMRDVDNERASCLMDIDDVDTLAEVIHVGDTEAMARAFNDMVEDSFNTLWRPDSSRSRVEAFQKRMSQLTYAKALHEEPEFFTWKTVRSVDLHLYL